MSSSDWPRWESRALTESRQVLEAVVRPATLGDVEAIRGIYNHAVLNTMATLDDVARSPGE